MAITNWLTGYVGRQIGKLAIAALIVKDLKVTGSVVLPPGAIDTGTGDLVNTGTLTNTGTTTFAGTIQIIDHAGAPDNTVLAPKNALCIDSTNSQLYINSGTNIAPVWKEFTRAA